MEEEQSWVLLDGQFAYITTSSSGRSMFREGMFDVCLIRKYI